MPKNTISPEMSSSMTVPQLCLVTSSKNRTGFCIDIGLAANKQKNGGNPGRARITVGYSQNFNGGACAAGPSG